MTTTKVAITLPKIQLDRASKIAQNQLGFKFPELVRYLLAGYIESHQNTDILGKKLIDRLEQEYETYLIKEEKQPSAAFTNVDDFINSL